MMPGRYPFLLFGILCWACDATETTSNTLKTGSAASDAMAPRPRVNDAHSPAPSLVVDTGDVSAPEDGVDNENDAGPAENQSGSNGGNFSNDDSALRFILPIQDGDQNLINEDWVIGIDHGPDSSDQTQCTNFMGQGFPFCYNGHEGTDFLVRGGFATTDVSDVHVVAAASGRVTKVEDGHYDRCHGELGTGAVSCDGHPMIPNVVHIEHAMGVTTRYLHLKKNSIMVKEGDQVECGQRIALVGSSGYSSFPHLHFSVRNEAGAVIDPYSGIVNRPESMWVLQTSNDGLPGSLCP